MSLEAAAAALTIPGLPGWTGFVALLFMLLLGLAFLAMPFSVFGVKSRLEAVEAQLDEMQAQLRSISARLGEAEIMPQPAIRRRSEPQVGLPRIDRR
jgi:Tfp pilus assembly protein PilO